MFDVFGDEGVIERVLPPNKWSGVRHRYLVRFVAEYGGKKHVTKFQYRERKLIANAKKYAKKC